MPRMKTTLALLLSLACTPALLAAEPGADVQYASGPVPERFDLHVEQTSARDYETEGKTYTFDGLIAAIKERNIPTVLLQGRGTKQDVLCASTIGVETGAAVFLIGDGRPKSISWKTSAKDAAKAAKDCRA
jgi:hypothetical protein